MGASEYAIAALHWVDADHYRMAELTTLVETFRQIRVEHPSPQFGEPLPADHPRVRKGIKTMVDWLLLGNNCADFEVDAPSSLDKHRDYATTQFTFQIDPMFGAGRFLEPWKERSPQQRLLCISVLRDFANPTDDARVAFALDAFRRALPILKSEFMIVDDLGKRMYSRRKEDPRVFAWGVTVYGPSMVAKIGRERLLSAPAFKVEELDWGGVWVQLAENPLRYNLKEARSVEKYLQLAESMGEGPSEHVQRAEDDRELMEAARPPADQEPRPPSSLVLVAGVDASDVGIVEGLNRFESVNGDVILGLEVARLSFEADPDGVTGPLDAQGLQRAVERVGGLVKAAGFEAEPGPWIALQDEQAAREGS